MAAPILARQINPFCTPQPENAERSETAQIGGYLRARLGVDRRSHG
jgi:hypothetical protein